MANGDLPGAGQVQGSFGAGMSAINNFDPTSTANSQRGQSNSLFNQQQGTSQDYMKQYAGQVAQNPTVTSLYNQANEQFNVPNLASQANYLNNQVTNQLPMQQQLMRGFDASQGQVDNATNQALRYLQPQATAAQNNLNTAQGLASNYVQAGQAQNAQNLLPIQAYGPLLQQNMAAQATGWNQASQNEFAGLQAKMDQGVALSQSEMSAMAQLTAAKEQYDAAIAGSQAQVQSAQIGAGKPMAPTETYYNPFYTGSTYNPYMKR